ncbi:MAG: di-heme oxidoredictase family protein [Tahibacter sp.]
MNHGLVCMILLLAAWQADAQVALPRVLQQPQRPRPDATRPVVPPADAGFGSPLSGLTTEQRMAFAAGLDEFQSVEDVEGGLGPTFNNVSCVSCHGVPAIGGSANILVTRFGRATAGNFDPLAGLGGSLLQQFAIDPAAQERVPPEANVVARRQATPLFGLGLIEAIPDATIVQNAARQKPDGVRGLPAEVLDVVSGQTRIGHFGWKAQQATLLAFAGDAYLNEMGVTSRFFPQENAPNGNLALLAQFDSVADPEDTIDPATGKGDIDVAADFMRLLAPPPRLPMNTSARAGESLFSSTGCAACHQPQMLTGESPIRALDRKPVNLYSDLLLHDMGALGDGIEQGFARARDIKTPPLWGLRASGPYLHDGRAAGVEQAIFAHDGEARPARDRYSRLNPTMRRQLLDFLATL